MIRNPAFTTTPRAAATGRRSATRCSRNTRFRSGSPRRDTREPASTSGRGQRPVPLDISAHEATRPERLPGRAVAPGRVRYRNGRRRIHAQDDGSHPGNATGRRVGRSPGSWPKSRTTTPTRSLPNPRAGQKKLWETGVAFEGPDTDTLTGDNRDQGGKGIHFSPKGLQLTRQDVGRESSRVPRQGTGQVGADRVASSRRRSGGLLSVSTRVRRNHLESETNTFVKSDPSKLWGESDLDAFFDLEGAADVAGLFSFQKVSGPYVDQ